MIRAVLATAITLVGTWYAEAIVLVSFDERDHRKSGNSVQQFPAQHTVSDPDSAPSVFLREQSRYPAAPSDLLLKSASVPAPRPTKVTTFRPMPRPATPEEILQGGAIPSPPASLRNASDLSCIAVAIYHEARDQQEFGQRAVASVIVQRAAIPHRWGDTACDTVVPTQFSFLTSRYDYPTINDMKAWERAVRFAAQALVEGPMPELKGADHYHTTSVAPNWASDMDRVRLIDDHVFYVDPRSSRSL